MKKRVWVLFTIVAIGLGVSIMIFRIDVRQSKDNGEKTSLHRMPPADGDFAGPEATASDNRPVRNRESTEKNLASRMLQWKRDEGLQADLTMAEREAQASAKKAITEQRPEIQRRYYDSQIKRMKTLLQMNGQALTELKKKKIRWATPVTVQISLG